MIDNTQDRYSTIYRRGNRADTRACPPGRALADLAAGRAWPWQRRRLVEHLGTCNACADDYRVLTAARGGLVSALESFGHTRGRSHSREPGWLRPALAAAAVAAFVALGAAVLFETRAPGPVAERTVVFAGEFESRPAPPGEAGPAVDNSVVNPQPGEVLFRSDFSAPGDTENRVFSDDFDA